MDKNLERDLDILSSKATGAGASAAKIVEVAKIRTGAWTRMKCQYGCPNYGATLCCPPYTPDYAAMQQFLSEYAWGILIEYTVALSEEDFKNYKKIDSRMGKDLLDILLTVEREAFFQNHYRSFALKAGRCTLCEKCNLVKCVNPTKARPSLEACGIDVFALANDNGFPMKTITGPISELKVYGMVLIE
ncbi:MAG: DUF2284 domain-containing protein [Phascolarctobacterium sp.]|nr:DUF2284 domain-containing protein [Phascolarctobacterium sp.]